jgi:hypothetical protein
MKKLLIGLLLLGNFSAYAQGSNRDAFQGVCSINFTVKKCLMLDCHPEYYRTEPVVATPSECVEILAKKALKSGVVETEMKYSFSEYLKFLEGSVN